MIPAQIIKRDETKTEKKQEENKKQIEGKKKVNNGNEKGEKKRRKIPIAEDHICEVLVVLRPVSEVPVLVHDHHSHLIGEVQQLGVWWIVRHAPSIHSFFFLIKNILWVSNNFFCCF